MPKKNDDIGHVIPARYPLAEEVPKGGSSCANCYYLSSDEEHCNNRLYREDMKTRKLGAAADRWCCMLWSRESRTKGG